MLGHFLHINIFGSLIKVDGFVMAGAFKASAEIGTRGTYFSTYDM